MARIRHTLNGRALSRPKGTISPEWSGVTGAPHCRLGCTCPHCGEPLHAEASVHYCPACDDFVCPTGTYHEAKG